MYLACRQGQMARAQRLQDPILRLTTALFRSSNPVPLKYALSLLGLMSPNVRLPLVELDAETKGVVAAALAQACDRYAEDMVGTPTKAQNRKLSDPNVAGELMSLQQ
jgi:4-hydroxy-tetrahydrodipicolinate synthase